MAFWRLRSTSNPLHPKMEKLPPPESYPKPASSAKVPISGRDNHPPSQESEISHDSFLPGLGLAQGSQPHSLSNLFDNFLKKTESLTFLGSHIHRHQNDFKNQNVLLPSPSPPIPCTCHLLKISWVYPLHSIFSSRWVSSLQDDWAALLLLSQAPGLTLSIPTALGRPGSREDMPAHTVSQKEVFWNY